MTDTHETLREAVARAMRLSAPELQSGQVWEYVTVKQSQVMADAAIATIFERLRTPQQEIIVDLAASLAAAISLLERGGKAAKKAAPSDKMFDLMVKDYKASLNRARKALTAFQQENNQ